MSKDNIKFKLENEKLLYVLSIIKERIKKLNKIMKEKEEKLVESRKEVFQTFDPSGSALKEALKIQELNLNQQDSSIYVDDLRKLKRLAQTPYFARIDFKKDNEQLIEKIYIGISTLIDQENDKILIYDWRAPISSMFYDYGLGNATYKCEDGKIQGEIRLKRQFKIIDGRIDYMFDSAIKIDDEILQRLLSQSSTGNMKQIISSIQREQNQIIRNDHSDFLIVQGAAGSGKTSIALHRIAFLLYKYRNKITSKNILILSPNYLFSSYISDVLPELGEENILQFTLQDYAEKYLAELQCEILNANCHLEKILLSKDNNLIKQEIDTISYKNSANFFKIIDNYINLLEKKGVEFRDIVYQGDTILSRNKLKKLWEKYSYLPYYKRLKKIKRRFFYILKDYKKERFNDLLEDYYGSPLEDSSLIKESLAILREELKPVKEFVNNMLSFDFLGLYLELYKNKSLFKKLAGTSSNINYEILSKRTVEGFSNKLLRQEDIPALLYFKRALTGEDILVKKIKYVFIDEAQDYSYFTYQIIKQLFPDASYTILGDLNQSIYSHIGVERYNSVVNVFKPKSFEKLELKRSYRSTATITNFAKSILPQNDNIIAMERKGEKPQLIRLEKTDKIEEFLFRGIERYQEKGAKSIWIICITESQSREIYNRLYENCNIVLIDKDSIEFNRELPAVIPSYLAKGLEFDAVLFYIESDYDCNYIFERKLLYTIFTRALHFLSIYYVEKMPGFIKEIDSELYDINIH